MTVGRADPSERKFSPEEVKKHNSSSDGWIVVNNCVYDVTGFIDEHPGGDILVDYLGKDASSAFQDPALHAHSDVAVGLLAEYKVGLVEGHVEPKEASHSHVVSQSGNPLPEEAIELFKNINYERGLAWQAPSLGKYYHDWVHSPLPPSVKIRYFDIDFFEFFSKMPWWAVPLFWGPVIVFLLWKASTNGISFQACASYMTIGVLLWCFVEYFLHKYLFHMTPTSKPLIWFHFMLHGSHHLAPMDKQRLVFPIIPGIITACILVSVLGPVFEPPYSYAAYAGLLVGYMFYDLTHYYLHHGSPMFEYMKQLKSHHLHHHYKSQNTNFGISSPMLDIMFGTRKV